MAESRLRRQLQFSYSTPIVQKRNYRRGFPDEPMPERVTANRVAEFVECLEKLGGSASNGRLRETLGWEAEFYWKVQGKLVEEGRIVPGRGKGGSVRLTAAESGQTPSSDVSADRGYVGEYGKTPEQEELSETFGGPRRRKSPERPLYEPIKATIETTWILRFGFDDFRVEETHSQGPGIPEAPLPDLI